MNMLLKINAYEQKVLPFKIALKNKDKVQMK